MASEFGTGVYYKQETGRWVAQLPVQPDGTRPSKTFKTGPEAKAWRDTQLDLIRLGLAANALNNSTVEEFMELFFTKSRNKTTTNNGNRARFNRFIKGKPFGQMKLTDVRAMHIDDLIDTTPENYTRVFVITTLSTFFDWCIRFNFLDLNPYVRSCGDDERRRIEDDHEMGDHVERTWTLEQLARFFAAERNPLFLALWLFLTATGLRQGEALGMRWIRVHLDQFFCEVADNVTNGGGTTVVERRPKGKRKREAYFGPFIGKVLGSRQVEQAKFRDQFFTWDEHGWVFDKRVFKPAYRMQPGIHLEPQDVSRRFHRVTDRAGLPRLSGPHGMRRTFATLAAKACDPENGKPLFSERIIAGALGHKPSVTAKYFTPSEEELRELALWIDRVLGEIVD